MTKLTAKVSATSANIGSGFDAIGIALNLYNIFTLDFTTTHGIEYLGIETEYANENHLVLRTFFDLLEDHHVEVPRNFTFSSSCDIPIARGLGSSSACIVAGLLMANEYGKLHLTTQQLLEIACRIEGHPDNVAPALLGQLVCALIRDNQQVLARITPIHASLRFLAIIPDEKVSTHQARTVLRQSVLLSDAVFNHARTALLPAAFSAADKDLLAEVTQDRLHQKERFQLISNSDSLLKSLHETPVLAYWISGSGSTVIALTDMHNATEVQSYLKSTCASTTQVLILKPDNHGSTLTISR